MANTKKFKTTRTMRKGIKRSQRAELKTLFGTLTGDERRKLRKEPKGLRKFVAEARKA